MMTVTKRYESTKNSSGIITLNDAWVHDENIDRFSYKRIYGRIESVPARFTQTVVEIKDPGYPAPRKHISGEHIQMQINKGLRKYEKYKNQFYCCAGFDKYEVRTMAEIARKTDIRQFDKIYFDPRVTEPENLIGKFQGREMYKVDVSQIICVVRDQKIIMQGGWCLVEPDYETWAEITTPSGIIMKPNPEAKYLRGIMRHFKGRDDVKEGDTIVYCKGADWTLKIEGKEYYAIEHDDVLCKIN